MEEAFEKNAEQAAAFQKMWLESMSKVMQAAFTFSPNSPPPELMRQIRSGIFAALADSWDKFMRSPEFLETMRQWMEQAIAFRKTSSDFMARVRNELQSPSRDDIDTVMLTVRHMEKRLLDRMETLAAQINEITQQRGAGGTARAKTPGRSRRPKARAGRPSNGQK